MHEGKVEIRLHVIGREFERTPANRLGLGDSTAAAEKHAKIVQRLGIVRLELEGAANGGLGLGVALLFIQENAKIEMPGSCVRR